MGVQAPGGLGEGWGEGVFPRRSHLAAAADLERLQTEVPGVSGRDSASSVLPAKRQERELLGEERTRGVRTPRQRR